MTLYKITRADGSPCHGGRGRWDLPTAEAPGNWRTEKGPLQLCSAGTLHLCRVEDFLAWAKVDAVVWEAETAGETRLGTDKVGALRARLVRKVGVLTHRLLVEWACDCADRGLSRIENPDPRSVAAVHVTRKWLAGSATIKEVYKAAAAAAAANAAHDAANAAYAAAAAAAAAYRAAYAADAAYHAAYAAYYAANRTEERKWQGDRLLTLLRRAP